MSIRIVRLSDNRSLAEFIEFSWIVNSGDRLWVPPLRERVFHELSGRSVFSRYGRFQLFVCEADGHIAGRIAALVNPRLLDRSGRALGQLGYFECLDDPAVASALIGAGLDWLQAQQVQQVIAPMNGGAHRAHRFLTRGFDRAPFLFEPRNPPYYPALFERCGFEPISRWFSYDLSRQQAADRVQKLDRVLARQPAPGQIVELAAGHPGDDRAASSVDGLGGPARRDSSCRRPPSFLRHGDPRRQWPRWLGLQHAIAGGFNDVVVSLVVEGWLSRIGEQTREYTLYARARSRNRPSFKRPTCTDRRRFPVRSCAGSRAPSS